MDNGGNCFRTLSFIPVVLGFLLPTLISTLTIGKNTDTMFAYIMIFSAAVLQNCLAVFGGVRLMMEIVSEPHKPLKSKCLKLWSFDVTDISTLGKGCYILYILVFWITANLICVSINSSSPLVVQLVSYTPPFGWSLGMILSFLILPRAVDNYVPV